MRLTPNWCGKRKGKGSSSELVTTLRPQEQVGDTAMKEGGRVHRRGGTWSQEKPSEGVTGPLVELDHRVLDLQKYNADPPTSFQQF